MSPRLSIIIDTNVELVDAHIFTPGQGICLEKLSGPFEKDTCIIVFQKRLACGSWYDVLIRINGSQNQQTYIKKHIYLTVNKFVQLSDILHEENCIDRNDKPKWQCKNKSCAEWNEGGIKICLHCYTNRSRRIIQALSCVPVVGIPFSVTHAALETGRAVHTKERHDKISAGLSIGTAAVEIVLAPVFVHSLWHMPAKAAATAGTQVTSSTLLTPAGKAAATAGTQVTSNTLFTPAEKAAASMMVTNVSHAVRLKSNVVAATEKICEASKSTKKTNEHIS